MRRAWAAIVDSAGRAFGSVGAVMRTLDMQDAHLYGGLALGAFGGERIYPGVGLLLAGAAAFWLAIRKVG